MCPLHNICTVFTLFTFRGVLNPVSHHVAFGGVALILHGARHWSEDAFR